MNAGTATARRWLGALLAIGLLQAPADGTADRFAAALADYRAGRYAAALDGFAAELAAAGDAAPTALRLDAALAALRQARTGDAEAALGPLGGDDDAADPYAADVAFVRGMIAWQRAERALAAARLPDAEPMAWAAAGRALDGARQQFARAAARRGDWPAALRNAERVFWRAQEFERERAAAQDREAKREPPPAPPPESPRPDTQEVAPELATARLSAAELRALQQRVEQQQRDKLRLRREQQRLGGVAGVRDW